MSRTDTSQRTFKKCLAGILGLVAVFSFLAPQGSNPYAQRRDRLRQKIKAKALLYSGALQGTLDKNIHYLTGLKDGDAVLLMSIKAGDDFLFLRDVKDSATLSRISAASGIDKILPRKSFELIIPRILLLEKILYFPVTRDSTSPQYAFLSGVMKYLPLTQFQDLYPALGELRIVKSAEEIALIKEASEITAAGVRDAMVAAAPGMYEYDLQHVIEGTFRILGAERQSFPSIIGSGPNSIILHYDSNTRKMEAGDVVVMDVGAEYSEYAGDVTRTIPVSGMFTSRQRQIYDIVLEAQRRAIEACKPGARLSGVDAAARTYIAQMGYGQYFVHSTSHSLGLDVHDPQPSDFTLAAGMIITVEPGIYIQAENLGVRIEDDVLITADGCLALSSGVPKNAGDIERLMAERLTKRY